MRDNNVRATVMRGLTENSLGNDSSALHHLTKKLAAKRQQQATSRPAAGEKEATCRQPTGKQQVTSRQPASRQPANNQPARCYFLARNRATLYQNARSAESQDHEQDHG
jgi:hypothetical protein